MCMPMQCDNFGCGRYNSLLRRYIYYIGIASETVASTTADCYVYCSFYFCLNFENCPCVNLY